MNEEDIRRIVRETIEELMQRGLIKDTASRAYTEASALIKSYYARGQKDPKVRRAIESVEHDRYYKIIPLYYYYGYTIEEIAESFDVETSTIVRNKKRLCLEIYGKL